MGKVDIDLYKFLEECECSIMQGQDEKIIAWANIDFCKVEEFVNVVGMYAFDEEGMECYIQNNSICIQNLDEILEARGDDIEDYRGIFEESEWERIDF